MRQNSGINLSSVLVGPRALIAKYNDINIPAMDSIPIYNRSIMTIGNQAGRNEMTAQSKK
jgi:hypothetical protein